ncbi:oligosaccharide flippase family protein [Proteus cibi]|uniref:oligosaccharide flippase family protein n=1 Tax=Proteus cibi TaxID=2050966 RepID=UPI0035A67FB2
MSLKKNIINLFGTQIIGYLVPLLQYPYLTRVIGTEFLGLYIFSLSIINIANIITNFGFDISISKNIAKKNKSFEDLSKLNFSVAIAKVFLLFPCVILLLITSLFTDYYAEHNTLLFFIFLSIFGNAFNLIWLFQGLEKLYIYSRLFISTKITSLIFIFIFVKEKNDLNMLFIITCCQFIFLSIISYIYIFSKGCRFETSSIKNSLLLIKESSGYFFSRLGTSIYSTCGSFFLGLFSGSLHQVAIYGAAEQLYKAGVYAVSAISTPLIPYMARTENFKVFFKITLLSVLITLFGSSVGYFFGEYIITTIYSDTLIDAYNVLKVFMLTIIISIIGIHFGYPALIPLRKEKIANYSVLISGLLQLLMIFIWWAFNKPFTALTIAYMYFLCDLIMTLIRLYYFGSNYFNYKKNL